MVARSGRNFWFRERERYGLELRPRDYVIVAGRESEGAREIERAPIHTERGRD